MSIEFFVNNYSLEDNKTVKAVIKDNQLSLYIVMNIHLELIANGYRPEMDLDITNVFTSNTKFTDKEYNDEIDIKILSYNKDSINFIINGDEINCFGDVLVK